MKICIYNPPGPAYRAGFEYKGYGPWTRIVRRPQNIAVVSGSIRGFKLFCRVADLVMKRETLGMSRDGTKAYHFVGNMNHTLGTRFDNYVSTYPPAPAHLFGEVQRRIFH